MNFCLREGSAISIQTLTLTNGVNVYQLAATFNENKNKSDLAQFKFGPQTDGLMAVVPGRLLRVSTAPAAKIILAQSHL